VNRIFRRVWAVSLAWPLVTVLATSGVGTGCTDTKYDTTIVEVGTPAFNQPADSLNGFLGLYNVADNQTTCGNCHTDYQASWAETKHASAWPDLEASDHASDACRPCHTVNERGNALVDAGGWNVVPDSTYHNVQCESCHGAGLTHVESVLAGNVIKPLASIAVDTVGSNGCAGCHKEAHHPFLEEWKLSKHGYGGTAYIAEGSRDPCRQCHEGRAAIRVPMSGLDPRPTQTGGDMTEFVESTPDDNYQPIVCAVCHDPHDATNEGQLRRPLDESSLEQLCARCHSREGEPEPGGQSRRGPHGAQGSIVMDEEVGWLPPTWPYTDRVVGSHTAANPRQCAACHVAGFAINDADGAFIKNYVGHTFQAIPCIDPVSGDPQVGADCEVSQRSFVACATSGCHASVDAAKTAFQVVRQRMNTLTDALWADDGDAVMETTDGGLLPKILAQAIGDGNLNEINLYDNDPDVTPAEGAIWNAQLASTDDRPYWRSFKVAGQKSCTPAATCTTKNGSNTGHRSSADGVHNPFLLEALLIESIDYLKTYYGVSAPPGLDLTPKMAPPAGLTVLR
jgi:predicted CXXCH cytochrome family protein